jgi:hypothetical protein
MDGCVLAGSGGWHCQAVQMLSGGEPHGTTRMQKSNGVEAAMRGCQWEEEPGKTVARAAFGVVRRRRLGLA